MTSFSLCKRNNFIIYIVNSDFRRIEMVVRVGESTIGDDIQTRQGVIK